MSEAVAEKVSASLRPREGDVLMVCVGATTGTGLCSTKNEVVCAREECGAFASPNTSQIRRRRPGWCSSCEARKESGEIWAGVKEQAQPCLYINRMKTMVLPLPPLAEQKRIVAKVDQLMALCDDLEAKQNKKRDLATQSTLCRSRRPPHR